MDEGETVFGIEKLDNLTLGRIGPGTIGLIYGPTGCGKSTLGAHYLFRGASESHNVSLLTTDPPSSVAASYQRHSKYDSSWIKDGYITVFMVQNLMDLIGAERVGADYKDLRSFVRLVCNMIETMDLNRVLIDPGRPILDLMNGLDQTELLHDLKDTLMRNNASAMIVYDTGIRDSWDTDRIPHPHLFDIVIRCDREERRGPFSNTMSIERWKGAPHSRMTYILDLSYEGVMIVPRIDPSEGE
jgi:KaiC/GvpD/RAD55 family RecA-like ATPase